MVSKGICRVTGLFDLTYTSSIYIDCTAFATLSHIGYLWKCCASRVRFGCIFLLSFTIEVPSLGRGLLF